MNLIPLTIADSTVRIGEQAFALDEADEPPSAGSSVTLAVPETAIRRVHHGGAEGEVDAILPTAASGHPLARVRLPDNVFVVMPTEEHISAGMHIRIAIDPTPCALLSMAGGVEHTWTLHGADGSAGPRPTP